ncbi:MAG TPA: toll/interleukin-1 receptor domain-containing protein [Candidatus Binatia bacterium]|nr:toll/interleukin-1 receptor domain-containing protein [Candidatus Binatia bacterium]
MTALNALDVFISYAHADDEVPQGAPAGWVTTLIGELKKILRRKLGGSGAAIWMDHELAANQNVTAELLDKLRVSRVLVMVMSPGYQQSPWCQRELANFLLAAEARRLRENVFVVEIEPVDWPQALKDLDLTPIRFWNRGFDAPVPVLYGYPLPPPDAASPYWRHLNELAHWVATRLVAQRAAPAAPARTVLVAETTDDLLDQRESVAALLRQHQFEPVPARAYPHDTEAAYVRALRDDLRRGTLFVQLLGPYEGRRLPDTDAPMIALQTREALAAQREGAITLIQWRDPGLDLATVKSDTHRALLAGAFVQACGFEQFRHEILRLLSHDAEPAPAAKRAAPAAARQLSIFVDADAVDADLASAVCESLGASDVQAVRAAEPAQPPSFARALEQQRETIRRCHGVLFVYGRATLNWLSARVGYATGAVGLRRDDVWGAVLDGPPADDRKLPFRSRNLLNLDCRTGYDPATLDDFVATLRARPRPADA